jgi:L-alanine-DL-glutamate epimerase-like enolase superfamily enzyme
MALYDLAGKLLDVPLASFLGIRQHRLATSITIGIQSVDNALAEASEYIGQGFRILKVKIGDSLGQDVDLLTQLRAKVGPRINIRVDANQGYTSDELADFIGQTRDLKLELIEQPLRASADARMRHLPDAVRSICAADESLCTLEDAIALACTPQPFGIYNIKLMKCGGMSPALDMIRVAEAAHIDLMWGCNDESCVSIAAALHTALSTSATRYLDLDGSFDLGRDRFKGGFVLENGALRPNDQPGLGVTLLQ